MKKPFAITLDVGTSLENRTGSWRTLRPTYVHKLPPCNHQCPAGEDIQGWLFYAESGNYEKAWRHLTKRNPLPSCMGRVCYHTCEGACNRGKLDASVGINSVERFLGDNALENGYKFVKPEQKTGKKVLIVGSGPAGLSAAYQLALKGHEVTIKEGSPEAGGMMRYGIPKYRLPRRVLDQEIARILDLGVKLELNKTSKKKRRLTVTMQSFSQSVPAWLKTPTSRAAMQNTCLTLFPFSAPWKAKKSLCSAVKLSFTAAAIPLSTSLVLPSVWVLSL